MRHGRLRQTPVLFLACILVILALAAAPARATRFYVNHSAPGSTHDGASWATAYLRVQDAISAGGAQGAEIWVAAGTYMENIRVPNATYGFQIYGGFAGVETARTERDPAAHVTTLDGNRTGTTVTFQPGVYSATVLDGFTITRGSGTGIRNPQNGNEDKYGAGILCLSWSSPIIRNNTVTGNSAYADPGDEFGGGIAVLGGNPVIEGNTIKGNYGTHGGGIYCASGTIPRIEGNTIEANGGSYRGGGVYAGLGSYIGWNRILKSPDGVGIYIAGFSPADPSAGNTVIEGNLISENDDGGIAYGGGDPAVVGTPFITIRNNLVRGNRGATGSGLYLFNAYGRICNNTIVRNTSFYTTGNQHGAIYVYNTAGTGAPIFSNNIIAYNSAGIYDATVSGTRLYAVYNAFFSNGSGALAYDYYAANPNPDPTIGNGNIKSDPRFAHLSTYETLTDYHLDAASPCIDAGENTASAGSADLDGEPRTDGARIDMGAYEFIHGLTLAFTVQPTSAGINEDIVPAPVVTVLRPNGQVYTRAGAVWVALKPGTGGPGAVLRSRTGLDGGIGAYFVNGVATFPGLYLSQAGMGNVITATWAGISVDSQPFTVMLRTRFVCPTGNDANDGSTWLKAKRTVVSAVDGILAPGGEVHVGKGTYTGTFTLPAGAKLLGGYDGGVTACWDCRDIRQNISVLDGAQGGAVVTIARDAGPDTLLEGFTITNGSGRRVLDTLRRMQWKGGGIFSYSASATIRYNRIVENTATVGGGIYVEAGAPVLLRNVIEGNSAAATEDFAAYGGGLAVSGASAVIAGNLIRNNRATGVATASHADSSGGGVWCGQSDAMFRNNTLVGNAAAYRPGGVLEVAGGRPRFVNNIFAYNGGGLHAAEGSEIVAAYNDVFHNADPDYTGPGEPFGPRRNLLEDPRFVDLSGGDLRLRDGSPCINAGDNSVLADGEVDLDGTPRPNDGIVDIGAYERRVLNVESVAFLDETHLKVTYSDTLNETAAGGALIPENYAVVDLDNAGAALPVTVCQPVDRELNSVRLAFATLPLGHRIRITVTSVRSLAGILVNPLKNTASLTLPVQVTFYLTDYLDLRAGKFLSVSGTFNNWGPGPTLTRQAGTYVSVSEPVWITPGWLEYRYCLADSYRPGSPTDSDTMNPVNRGRNIPPIHPQAIRDVIGADVRTTFNLTVYADRAIPAGKDVYVTGGFTGWSTAPGAVPGPIKLVPVNVVGGRGFFTATATIKQLVWTYRYILVDRATLAVDDTWLNPANRAMDMQPTGTPLSFIVNDTAGTPTKIDLAARILRIGAGMENSPAPASDPAFPTLDVNGDKVIDRLDAVKVLR